MSSFQGAQSASSSKSQAQVPIVPEKSYSVEACSPPLGNTVSIEDGIRDTAYGNTSTEPESRAETHKQKGIFSRSQSDKTNTNLQKEVKKANTLPDEAYFENMRKKVNVIKTVTLILSNELDTESLNDPDVFTINGKNHSLFKDVSPGETKRFLFGKTPGWCRGAVGICTYRVGKSDDRVAIYYSNPFIGYNSFGLQWVTAPHVTDANTYEKLFSGDNKWFVRHNMSEKKMTSLSGLYVAKAFMTQGEHAEMYATVSDRIDD